MRSGTFRLFSNTKKVQNAPQKTPSKIAPITAPIIKAESSFFPNTYFVDSTYGNDTSGSSNNSNKPFKSIRAAMVAYRRIGGYHTANIIIRSGYYMEQDLLLTNANFLFDDGTIVENISPLPLFADTSSSGFVFTVKGKVTFMTNKNGPILQFINSTSVISLECDTIQADEVCPISVLDSASIYIKIGKSLFVNGIVKALIIMSQKCDGFIQSMLGTNTGTEIGCVTGGLAFQTINCVNGIIYYGDYPNNSMYTASNDKGAQFFQCNFLYVKRAHIDTVYSDTHWNARDANYTESFTISSESGSTLSPSAHISHGRIITPRGNISWNVGSLTFETTVLMDMGNGSLTLQGSQEGLVNPTTIVKISNLIAGNLYIGCDLESNVIVPKHASGYLSANIENLQVGNFYAMTMICSDTLPISNRPKLSLSGNMWRGIGSITSQTYGSINMEIKNLRQSVPEGGVLTIQDYGSQPSDNTGNLQIVNSIIKNECSTMATASSILTAIYAPILTNVSTQVVYTTLSIGLPNNSSVLSDSSARTIEPIYPVENFVSPPVLNVISYKNITTRLAGDSPSQPTRWSGANQYDPRVVGV